MIEYKYWRIVKGAYYFVIHKYTGVIYLRSSYVYNLDEA